MKWLLRLFSLVLGVLLFVGVIRVHYYSSRPLAFESLLARIETAQSKIDSNFETNVNYLGGLQKILSLANSKISTWLNQNYADMISSGSLWDIVKYGFSYIVSFVPKLVTGLVTVLQFLFDGITTLTNAIITLFKLIYYIFIDI